jgi:predicted outer membrane protein
MNVSLRRAVCSLVVLISSTAILVAQQPRPAAQPRTGQPRVQPGQPGQPGQFGRPGQFGQGGAQAGQLEPSVLTLLIIDNNKEISLAQLGEQISKNEDIKRFSEMIGKDHSNFVQKLQERSASGGTSQRLGGATGADQPATAAGQPARATTTATAPPRTGATQPRDAALPERRDATAQQDREQGRQRLTLAKPVIGNQPGAQLLQLWQEVAEKRLDSARKDAEKLSAEEFDKLFIGMQVIAHMEMLDKLQVFQQHVSPETAQLLADAQETTKKHLEEAKSICEKLEKSGEAAGRTRPTGVRENRENQ